MEKNETPNRNADDKTRAGQTQQNDERERANNGSWDDQRDPNEAAEGYDSNQNDNTGGAGSTGSAATNS